MNLKENLERRRQVWDKGVLLYHPSEVTYHDAIHKNNLTEIFFKITDLRISMHEFLIPSYLDSYCVCRPKM